MSGTARSSREVAYRVFAAEYESATHTYRESDEERAPNYVVTPTGVRVNRLFAVGVLTETERVGDGDVLRARVVDPTGAFVVYAGQYQPDALAALEDAEPPTFLAVTGKANTFTPEGSDRTYSSIRPESVAEVDADTRDRWVVSTAEHTLRRIAAMASALDREARGEELTQVLREAGRPPSLAQGIPRAISAYETGRAYLGALRAVAVQAVGQVAGDVDEVDRLTVDPDAPGDADVDLAFSPEAMSRPAPRAETDSDDPDTPQPADADPGMEAESESSAGDSVDAGARTAADPPAEPDDSEDLYELDEEEREAVESEYGVDFESGSDIPEAGEAGIETPDPDDGETPDADEAPTEGEASPDADLEDVVVETMRELGDGGGVEREVLIERVLDDRDTDREAIEAAIQDALMAGRCYESGDTELTPI
ncbi:MAG: hypothetical protein ABEJ35_02830 [Halobacteriaceae archaeon]